MAGGEKSSAQSLTGERRQVTALFYDVVGSTELLDRIGPEDFGEQQRLLHKKAAEIIVRHGGNLERIQGDGGCAYFGFPVAIEDSAEAAITAALEMTAQCKEGREAANGGLSIRVGVATGVVVIADLVADLPGRHEIVGLAPTLAARLQAEAAPNTVAAADTTYRMTSSAFEFERLGKRNIRGFSEPLRIWRPHGRRPHLDRFTASRRIWSKLTGRNGELDQCLNRFALARGRQGQTILVSGEAGIGKSRLTSELRDKVGTQCEVRVFQCHPRGHTRPLHPFLEGMHGQFSSDGTLSAGAILAFFSSRGVQLTRRSAEVISFLGTSAGTTPFSTGKRTNFAAEEFRAYAINAMVETLTILSATRPQLILIEDLHWADTLTIELTQKLSSAITCLPIILVMTSRDTSFFKAEARRDYLHLALSSLNREAVSEIVCAIWRDETPRGLDEFIYERSEGVPLFAEELSLLLKNQLRTLGTTPRDWNRALRERSAETLQDLIAARLAALGDIRPIAQIGSVIGREFDYQTISAIAQDEEFTFSLHAALEQLVNAEILTKTGHTFRFRHALIQEAALDSLLKSHRRQLHGRLVDLIESGSVSAPSNEALAWHCSEGGRPFDAAIHAIEAAETCMVRWAIPEASQLLSFARQQKEICAPGTDGLIDLQLRLLTAQGSVATALHGRRSLEAQSIYEEGVTLCRETRQVDLTKWFPLYWGWWFTAPRGVIQRTRSEILVDELKDALDPEVRLQSLHCAWATNFDAAKYDFCLRCVRAALELYDEQRARRSRGRYGGHDARVCALGERALCSWFIGNHDIALESIKAMSGWAEELDHLESTFHALDYAVSFHFFNQDLNAVTAIANRMAKLAEEFSIPAGLAKALLFRGWSRALLECSEEGFEEFEKGYALQRKTATEENISIYNDMRASILAQKDRLSDSIALLNQALESGLQTGQVFWIPELYRKRAVLQRTLGESQNSWLRDLTLAIKVADEQGAKCLGSRARANLEEWTASP